MIKGSEVRKAEFPIERLLLDRWSPRAMSGEEIVEANEGVSSRGVRVLLQTDDRF